MKKIALNLTGGGARGAYQAGVLLGLGECLNELGLKGREQPFKIWVGASAGAINSAFCASQSEDLYETTQKLADMWSELKPEQVYQTDLLSLTANSARWIRDLSFGSLLKSKQAEYLLDTKPLLSLLQEHIPFKQTARAIEESWIESLACSAYRYTDGKLITFVQSQNQAHWQRPRRQSLHVEINPWHILASCSIPLLFPPTPVGEHYFGDGTFRSTTPMSPCIHLGGKKILMVGVRYPKKADLTEGQVRKPGVAQIAGSILNALFMDNIDIDIERIHHINEIVSTLGDEVKTKRSDYSPLELKIIQPSEDISEKAAAMSTRSLPKMVGFLLGGLGTRKETADLASYILFEANFTKQLIDLGYADFKSQKSEILAWLES